MTIGPTADVRSLGVQGMSPQLQVNGWVKAAVVLSGSLFGLAAAAATSQLLGSERISINGGCGWDGEFYCAMLKGTVVPEPYSRRILLPFLARQVSADTLTGFWVVNVLSLAAVTILAMYIAWKLRPEELRASLDAGLVPPLAVGAAFLSARNSFHIIATYPALTDALGLLLLVGAIALVVLPVPPRARWVLIPICFLAPLSREQLAAVLAGALVLAGLMRLLPWLTALSALAASLLGGALALRQPHLGGAQPLRGTVKYWLDHDFGSWQGFFRFIVMVMLAFGPFLLVLGLARGWNRTALWIVSVAAIFTAISLFAGGDTDRILTPAGLLIVLAASISVTKNERALLGLALLVAAYAVQQAPFARVGGDPVAWLTFFGLRVTTIDSVVHNGLVPLLIGLPIAVAGFILLLAGGRQRSGPTRA